MIHITEGVDGVRCGINGQAAGRYGSSRPGRRVAVRVLTRRYAHAHMRVHEACTLATTSQGIETEVQPTAWLNEALCSGISKMITQESK